MAKTDVHKGDTVIAFNYVAWEYTGHEISKESYWTKATIIMSYKNTVDICFEDGSIINRYPKDNIK